VLLAIDARNGGVSVGFFSEAGGEGLAEPVAVRRMGSLPGRRADEYALILESFARSPGGPEGAPAIGEAWMSCVVPSLSRELALAVGAAFGLDCSIVGPGVKTGVKIRTDIPSELGSDLVCEAAAARELAGGACVVIDFDAVLAFSAVGRSGDYLGAAFAPGLCSAAQCLRSSGALLPEVAPPPPAEGRACRAIGRNTTEALRAGLSLGYAGLVERLARLQAEELVALGEAESPSSVAILGTGGEEGRDLLSSLGPGAWPGGARFVPDLALRGLALIAGRARSVSGGPRTR
jgi:type III pantothenate kinase